MKPLVLIFIAAMILLTGDIFAQADQVDTVSIESMTVTPGREFTVNVNCWNDEKMGGVTVPLKYPTDKLEFVSLSFTGGRIDYLNSKPTTIDETAGTILVGGIVFMESYIMPGSGPLFSITFKLKDSVASGEIVTIDSTEIPPAYLLLSDIAGQDLVAVFVAGKITGSKTNQAPYFSPVATQYVAEGDSLHINLHAIDPNNDKVVIANPIHPYDSRFSDFGDGTARFDWSPDFVGPLSSDMSPFYFVFWTSDGQLSTYIRVRVNVINVNRPPVIVAPELVEMEAGDSVGITVRGTDPEFDPVTWQVSGLPSGATFDYENPGLISWNSTYADSGRYTITVIARDPGGLADTSKIVLVMAPVTLFSVRIDTTTTNVGKVANLAVYLKNKLDVRNFDFLINIDPSILTILSVTRSGDRAENLDLFSYGLNADNSEGYLRIQGQAGNSGQLPPGEGALCHIQIRVTTDLSFIGSEIPIEFVTLVSNDNHIKTIAGQTYVAPLVNFFNGYIMVATPGTRLLGDINLNGVAYEIADAVYFSNFFISPGTYPMSDRQLLNSDINLDGYAPSVADLVLLIKIIAGDATAPTAKPLVPSDVTAEVKLVRQTDGLFLTVNSAAGVGGAWFKLSGTDAPKIAAENKTDLQLMTNLWRTTYTCLLISYDMSTLSPGEVTAIKLSDDPNLKVSLTDADLADADGRVLQINKTNMTALPTNYELHQNYPNPFNPATDIRFDLPVPARVTLTVYNILGQAVNRLADGDFAAGQHTVHWDGTDNNGQSVASGVYFYRIKADSFDASRKMILLK